MNKQNRNPSEWKRYYANNKEKCKLASKKWREENPEKSKAIYMRYTQKPENKIKLRERVKKWRLKNREKYKIMKKKSDKRYSSKPEVKQKMKLYKEEYSSKPEVKQKMKLYNKEYINKNRVAVYKQHRVWRYANPRSSRKYSYDLQDAMNNVRIRDNNTCQWYGCGLTFRQVPIHVHHIFPRSEYPELELVEQYMICFCLNHHALWHIYRGDYYGKMILQGKESFLEKTYPNLLHKPKKEKMSRII